MNPSDVVGFLDTWGVLGVLVLILLAGHRGIWIFRREHIEVCQERDWWRGVATRALNIGEAAVGRREADGP